MRSTSLLLGVVLWIGSGDGYASTIFGVQGFLENRGQWSADLRYRSWVGGEAVDIERDALTDKQAIAR